MVSYGSGALLAFSAVVKFVGVNNANPLKLLYSNAPLNGVDILGGGGTGVEPNSNWMPVYVTLVDSATIMVNITFDGSQADRPPTALRYAWGDVPVASLYDSNDLPAWPFYFEIPPPPKKL